ncbi:radical SAM protein [Patescibacteria group bacterium]|nr:radical SAM protein [Patescibacteria group bacterium]
MKGDETKMLKLKSHVIIVEGATNTALYDLKTGNVFHINPRGRAVIGEFENGSDVNKFPEDQDFVNNLIGFGLLSNGSTEEEFNIDPDQHLTTGLRFAWYELTDRCTHRCIHCYLGDENIRTNDRMSLEDWKNAHEQSVELGIKKISLIGREPLLFSKFRELLLYLQNYPDIGIEIYTNGFLLTHDIIDIAKAQRISFATSFYSHNPETHDTITRRQGSWLKTKKAIEMILTAGLKLRVGIILMKQNAQDYKNTRDFLKLLGVEKINPDYVRPTGCGRNKDVTLGWEILKRKSRPNFSTSVKSFFKLKSWNSCLTGKIVIASNGDVLPCVFARNHIIGNVLEQRLSDIVYSDKLQDIWKLNRDRIDKCKDCEFRYACKDCRPLAESFTGCLKGCSPNCNYNPYTGEFEIEPSRKEVCELNSMPIV